jgi:2-polyprenyl-3-methyl-5-hydroxy-6-metoxy-1,4-benzoquinol methylase
LSGEHRDSDSSQQRSPGPLDWDASYRQHDWDYLAGIAETPRYALVAGYIHKLVGGGSVLDAGCGEGVLIDYLDLNRFKYCGFDISPTAIERAQLRHANVELLVASAENFIPRDNDKYDVIAFTEVLAQVESPVATLARFRAFLRPAGHIIVSQFHSPNPESKGTIFKRAFEAEIAAGRVNVVATSEVLNCTTGLRWTIYCLGNTPAAEKTGPSLEPSE